MPEYRPTVFRSMHRALADPLRHRLLDALWVRPHTAKELAGWAGVPADRLYYHLHQLEKAGLVDVVEYREVPGGRVERVYGMVAVEPPGDDATPEETAHFLGTALEATRADLDRAFAARARGADRQVMLHRGGARLTGERFAELAARFRSMAAAALERQDESGVWTGLLITMVDLEDRAPEAAPAPGEPRS